MVSLSQGVGKGGMEGKGKGEIFRKVKNKRIKMWTNANFKKK